MSWGWKRGVSPARPTYRRWTCGCQGGREKSGQIFDIDKLEVLCQQDIMARPLRIEYPGAYFHVMNRGNHGEDIFLSDKDRKVFLDGLAYDCES